MSVFFVESLSPRRASKDEPGNALGWSELLTPARDARAVRPWSAPEAFFAILYSAVVCDGEVMQVEREELLALAHRSRGLRSLSPNELAELNASVSRRLAESDLALRQACEALPEEMRLPAFTHALDLALADGELTIDESDFINTIIRSMNLDRDEVRRVADAMLIKNRF